MVGVHELLSPSFFNISLAASQLPDEVPGSLADEASSIDLTQQRRSVTRRLPTRRSPSSAMVVENSGLVSQNIPEEDDAPARSKVSDYDGMDTRN
jgi:hypothetical protein